MGLWTNIIFAWVALVLSFFLIVIWALRLMCKKRRPEALYRINRWLRLHHKLIGILLITTAGVHGLFSSDKLLSLNFGTITWVFSILLGLNWLLRKRMKRIWMTYHRVLTSVFVALVVIHIFNVGGFILDDMIAGDFADPKIEAAEDLDNAVSITPDKTRYAAETTSTPIETAAATQSTATTASAAAPSETPSDIERLVYADGTYTGTGVGFRPGLIVEVVITGGRIASVSVIGHNEQNEKFWGYPVQAIPEAIINAQSADVDSISGATMTSEGIKQAVEDALSKAAAG